MSWLPPSAGRLPDLLESEDSRKLHITLQIWSSSLSVSFTGRLGLGHPRPDYLAFIALRPNAFLRQACHLADLAILQTRWTLLGGRECALLVLVPFGSL